MARLARLSVAELPHYVIQRGVASQAVFRDDEDYQLILALLAGHAERERLAVHAYVLLPGEFQLLVTPSTDRSLSALMQAVGRRYVQAFNRRHGRLGTLWEGRFRATVLQPDRYLLPCMVQIDTQPVRTGLVTTPGDYAWSSYGHYAGARHDRLLTPPALYWALGNTPFAREARYSEQVGRGLDEAEQKSLNDAVNKGWALGDEDFLSNLEGRGQRRVVRARPGRPKRQMPQT